jgi:putative phosphoesterase
MRGMASGPAQHTTRVGVISDTHGLLRPEAVAALAGSDVIVHAGDIGAPQVLEDLRRIAPVTAVRGNMDQGAWALSLPDSAVLELGQARLYVTHSLELAVVDPQAEGFAAVITGHSHRPRSERRQGVLFFNPGSAGPQRFRLPVAVGRLLITGGRVRGELMEIGNR